MLILLLLELSSEPGELLLYSGFVFGKYLKAVLDLVVKIFSVVVTDRVEILLRLFFECLYLLLEMLVPNVDLMCDLGDHLSKIPLNIGLKILWRYNM